MLTSTAIAGVPVAPVLLTAVWLMPGAAHAQVAIDLNGANQSIGSLDGGGTVTNNGGSNAVLTAGDDNSDTTFSGLISDGTTKTTGLTKTGTGTLTMSGANTYSGVTNVSAGALELGNFGAAGTGLLTIGDATTLRVTAAGSGTLSNSQTRFAEDATGTLAAVAGTSVTVPHLAFGAGSTGQFGSMNDTGTIIVGIGGGISRDVTLVVAGGTLTTTNDTLTFYTSNAARTEVRAGATLDFNSQVATIARLTGGGTVKLGTSTLGISEGNFAGGIQGTGGVTVAKTGVQNNGTLILGGTGLNTYTGATTVTANHTLQGGAINAFSAASAATVTGTLDLGGFDQTIGSLAGAGTVTSSGGTTATLTAGGNNTSTIFSGVI